MTIESYRSAGETIVCTDLATNTPLHFLYFRYALHQIRRVFVFVLFDGDTLDMVTVISGRSQLDYSHKRCVVLQDIGPD